jgi:hypothetical protein
MIQFLINSNAECLKNACRGILVTRPLSTERRALRNRSRQIRPSPDRMRPTSLDQKFRQRSGEWFLTKFRKGLFQFLAAPEGESLSSRLTLRHIKPQIQRSLTGKTESTSRVGKLIRRESQIEQDSIHPGNPKLFEDRGQFDVARMAKRDIFARDLFGGMSEHHGIPIKPNESPLGADLPEDFPAMASSADGSIDNDHPGLKLHLC